MRSKLAVAVVLVAVLSVAIALWAAERGTFILRNGQRESGVLSAHTESRANLFNGFFNLGDMPGGTGNLREKAFPQDQVAVIDLAGGQPSVEELSQLNRMNGQPHLLVMRGGRSVPGRFDNIVGGDTVVFANQRYAVRDVARVYLDIDAAKTIFNVRPDPPALGNDRGQADQSDGAGIRVFAKRPWTDTGVTVRRGQRIRFLSTGQIWFAELDSAVAGPDGNPSFRGRRRDYPVPDAPVGALVGRIGDGRPFGIGSQTQPLVMPDDGVLYLGVNDANYDDNRGAFRVEITVLRR
jgi:hypothetical protein